MIKNIYKARDLIAHLPEVFAFKCPLDRQSIRAKFPSRRGVRLEGRGVDSEDYGLYLRARPISSGWPASLRLYGEAPPDYLLEFNYDYAEIRRGQSADHLVAFVKDKLLNAIGAADIKPTPSIR